jgi:hypothetical protein
MRYHAEVMAQQCSIPGTRPPSSVAPPRPSQCPQACSPRNMLLRTSVHACRSRCETVQGGEQRCHWHCRTTLSAALLSASANRQHTRATRNRGGHRCCLAFSCLCPLGFLYWPNAPRGLVACCGFSGSSYGHSLPHSRCTPTFNDQWQKRKYVLNTQSRPTLGGARASGALALEQEAFLQHRCDAARYIGLAPHAVYEPRLERALAEFLEQVRHAARRAPHADISAVSCAKEALAAGQPVKPQLGAAEPAGQPRACSPERLEIALLIMR